MTATKNEETQDVLIRGVPVSLLERIKMYAKKHAGPTGRPSRDAAIKELLRKALAVAR